MVLENATGWIDAGNRHGIDLSFLNQDKLEIPRSLQRLGLPCGKSHAFPGNSLDAATLDDIFKQGTWFCRLVPVKGGLRPYKQGISTRQELEAFCKPYGLGNYILNLKEQGDVTYTGCIIANDDHEGTPRTCIIELVEGDGPALFHGKKTPVHAEITAWRALHYSSVQPPTLHERTLVHLALSHIGGTRHPFPGYFEFDVWGKNDIRFRNYQTPDTSYGSI